jgi:hypothetical protein
MTKAEILFKIQSLLEQMNESIQKKYHGLKIKNKSELLIILQEVKYLFNIDDNEINNSDLLENSENYILE